MPKAHPEKNETTVIPEDNTASVMLARIGQLQNENGQLKREATDLQTQIATLTAATPAEGSIVLSTEDGAAWEAYKALGKPTELQELQVTTAKLKRNALIEQAAKAHGYEPSVLAQLLPELPIDIRQVADPDNEGKTKPTAFTGEIPLSTHIEANFAAFMPALKPATTTTTQNDGTPWPPQSSHSTTKKNDKSTTVKSILANRYAVPGATKEQ